MFLAALLCIAISSESVLAADVGGEDREKVVVTAADIVKMNAADIVDLLNHIPGITAGESSVLIRGSYDVKVFMDGQPLNDPLASYSKVKWNLVSLASVERIEIYKGSGAVAFGDGTSGGAIRITSKEVRGNQAKIKMEGGSLNTWQQSLNAGSQYGPFSVGVSADHFRTDGYRTNQDKEWKHFGLRTAFLPKEKDTSLNLALDYGDEDYGNAGYPAYPTPRSRETSDSFTMALAAKSGRVTSNTYGGSYAKRSFNPDAEVDSRARGWSLGEELSYRFAEGPLRDVTTGLSLRTEQISANSFGDHQEESYGLSLSKGMEFQSIPLHLTFGLRGNFYSAFETVVNPEIKLAYDLDRTKLQLSLTRTNNVPTVLKRFYATSSTRANPDLGMEKANNFSLSASVGLTAALEAGATAFYNEINDRITYVRDAQGSGGTYRNFGRVTRKGLDLTFDWKPFPWMNITPAYEYLVSKDEETGLAMACAPEHHLQVNLQIKPVKPLTAALVFEHTSQQYTRSDNSESAPPYSTVELRLDYAFRNWRIYGRIQNLADETYLYGDGFPAPPRTWLVGAVLEF
jgi:vitamin B12 transporter